LLQEEPGPSVQRDYFPLGGLRLRPLHRELSHRAVSAAHGLEIEAVVYKLDVEKPESDLFNQKVKEKNRECATAL